MKIFLDNNSSTQVDDRVIEAMKPYFTDIISPPGSDYGHSFSVEAKEALEKARETIALRLNSNKPEEIIFTSGQAESNNLAIKGLAFHKINQSSKLLVASSVSHSTVLESIEYMKKKFDFKVKLIDVDSEGRIKLEQLRETLSEKPILVSIPHGNVEIGTIENIQEISDLCQEFNTILHIDATFSFCKVPIDILKLNTALLTIAGHIIHGPKGVGALYIRKGLRFDRLIHGGLQENGRRGGIENIPGIVGFGEAVKMYTPEVVKKTRELRDYLWDRLQEKLPEFEITGALNRDKRLSNHFSFVVAYVEGESILLHMDMLGFMISTGSACSSKRLKASHVLSSIGLPIEVSHGSIRIGVSKTNTRTEIDSFIENLTKVVTKLREMSPVNAEFMKEWREKKAKGEVREDDHHHEI